MFVGELNDMDWLGADAVTTHDTPTQGEYGEVGAVYDNPQAAQAAATTTGVPQNYVPPSGGPAVTFVPQPAGAAVPVRASQEFAAGGIMGISWKTLLIAGAAGVAIWMLTKKRR